MPRPKKPEPRCSLCDRMMNSFADLTSVWKRGDHEPIRICSSGRCWTEARERGYRTDTSEEP